MKRTITVLACCLLAFCLSACSSYHGELVEQSHTDTGWRLSFQKFSGTISHTFLLNQDQPVTLCYPFTCQADSLKLTVRQDTTEQELPLGDTSFSLDQFKPGKLEIIIEAENAGESLFEFELVH